jgi:asparagine synthase (glutamine-hydrolysing)
VDFAGYAENFRPDPMRDTPDRPFVHELARYVEADHSDIVLSTDALMDPAVRSAVLRASDLPNGVGDLYSSLFLLFRAIRQHSTVALSGESADEIFGGYRWFHDPGAVAADTFPWFAMMARNRGFRSLLLDRSVLQDLQVDAYREASYRTALAEVPHPEGESGQEHRMREVCYLHLTRFLPILLDRKDRMSMASGLEVRVPFCDHRLVQYVFQTPWAMKTFDGREKSLLRAAVSDLLPTSILQRRKSPYPATQDPAYEQALRDELGKLLANEGPVTPLLDVEQARKVLDRPLGPVSMDASRHQMELVLQLDAWLRRYEVRLDLPGR